VFDNLGGVCLWICGERKVFDNLGEERGRCLTTLVGCVCVCVCVCM